MCMTDNPSVRVLGAELATAAVLRRLVGVRPVCGAQRLAFCFW